MRKRDEWIARIKRVEHDHRVAALALAALGDRARGDPTVLPADVRPRDLEAAAGGLEPTYLIRLYAVFESGLRDVWAAAGRTTQPPMRDLLDGLASTYSVPPPVLATAHRVREFRNGLVHEQHGLALGFTLADARGHLCRFFSHMPPDW